jgi:hypothetical protein
MSATEEAKYLASKNFGHKAITFKLHFEIKRGKLCGKFKL